MARWLVNQDEVQMGVDSLSDLVSLARAGRLSPGDMVQPPGATDWVYAGEIPQLAEVFPEDSLAQDADDWEPPRPLSGRWVVAALILSLFLGLGGLAAGWAVLQADGPTLLGAEDAYSQVLVKRGAALRAGPSERSPEGGRVEKDQSLALLAKRGEYYKVRVPSGGEGWLHTSEVFPLYLLAEGQARAEVDPLYNPDRYVIVTNASWMALDERQAHLTVFEFSLSNQSGFEMTDLVLRATIKDSRGNELERVEIPVEGRIPARGSTAVGTLEPARRGGDKRLLTRFTFEELAATDPELALRYKEGVEVAMKSGDFIEAAVDIVELRAIPD
ncbi:MAG: SH3 domain-containing protein [Deltaproteobacteria bacterium]|nr:SH3 domain-containing protein [Deltaproteobacteria bacterium]